MNVCGDMNNIKEMEVGCGHMIIGESFDIHMKMIQEKLMDEMMLPNLINGQADASAATCAMPSAICATEIMERAREAMGRMVGLNKHLRVVASHILPRFFMVQYRFPKTKRKRIRKKWRNDHRNFKTVENNVAYHVKGLGVVVPPHVAEMIT